MSDVKPNLRVLYRLALCAIALCLGGCLLPVGHKTTAGHKYSEEALAFLDLPGTTRSDVVASLGPPLLDSTETRTLVYEWEVTPKYIWLGPDEIGRAYTDQNPEKPVKGIPQQWALFIEYDDQEAVVLHEIRKLAIGKLQDACLARYYHRNNRD